MLDLGDRSCVRGVRVVAELALGLTLSKKVPALVKLGFDLLTAIGGVLRAR